jgi:hypothetical protein
MLGKEFLECRIGTSRRATIDRSTSTPTATARKRTTT